MANPNGNNSVLVTGASGMIGRQVVDILQRESYGVVRAQVRDKIAAKQRINNAFDVAMADFKTADFTMMLEKDYRALTAGCHTVVHTAGLVHMPDAQYQEYEVMNVRATQQLAEACKANKVNTLVFFSSSAVYGPGPFSNIDESAPIKATSPYAVSKSTSENFLRSLDGIPRIIVLRPSLVFGEGDRGNLIKMIREIKSERYKHIGGGKTGKSIIYARDCANSVLSVLQKTPPGYHVYNVANPQPVTVFELAETIGSALNIKVGSYNAGILKMGVKLLETFMPGKAPVTSEQLEKLTTETTCSVDKLVSETGFKPKTDLDKALKAEIAWADQNNLL